MYVLGKAMQLNDPYTAKQADKLIQHPFLSLPLSSLFLRQKNVHRITCSQAYIHADIHTYLTRATRRKQLGVEEDSFL